MEVVSNKFIYHLGQSFPNIFGFADWWARGEEGRVLCTWRSSLRIHNSICASCSCKWSVCTFTRLLLVQVGMCTLMCSPITSAA